MIRISIVALALLGLASTATIAQEVETPVECEPTTLFEAFGIEPVDGCEVEEEVEDVGEADDDAAGGNSVSAAAKLPGSNREAALAHANERSGGAVEEAHSRHGDNDSDGGSHGSGHGNGKK